MQQTLATLDAGRISIGGISIGLAQAALGAGDALGMDRKALAELINASSGRSFGFEVFARLPSPAAFGIGAPLLAKDVGLLKAVLPDHDGVPMVVRGEFLFSTTPGGSVPVAVGVPLLRKTLARG